jgi:uncharacterized protein with FMN-binding domain
MFNLIDRRHQYLTDCNDNDLIGLGTYSKILWETSSEYDMKRIKYYNYIAVTGLFLVVIIGCGTSAITGGPISKGMLKDGTYSGQATNGPVKVLAKVTIENQRITSIDLVEHRTWKGKAAEKTIPFRIIEKQSTKVDAVSGATMSSTAIMNAVETAINKAR